MPYIAAGNRAPLERRLREAADQIETAGELNFAITYLCTRWMEDEFKYADLNELIGVLECAKLEFYRRVCAPYEDAKMEEHGDVYSNHS